MTTTDEYLREIQVIYKSVRERCDIDAIPTCSQVVYLHDMQRFQVITPPPTEVLAEGETADDLIDVMVRQYPKKVPNLPSIPLTPRQRLFLASNPQEDKEAALQEIRQDDLWRVHKWQQKADAARLELKNATDRAREMRRDLERVVDELHMIAGGGQPQPDADKLVDEMRAKWFGGEG